MCHRTKQAVNTDTIELLKECEAGVKMATSSMEQIIQHVENPHLKKLIEQKNAEHIKLGEEAHHILNEAGEQDEDPNPVATFWAKAGTGMKMSVNGDSHQAASILTDGCNMGIKSISEYINKYVGADQQSVAIAEKLRSIETDMMKKLEKFL